VLILEGVREFVREDDAVLRVIERRVLIHEKLVRVLIVESGDLFAEEIDIFLAQRVARRQKPDGRHGLRHVLEFLFGKNFGQLPGDRLPDLLPAEHAVVHRGQELEPADGHCRPLDLFPLLFIGRERLLPLALRQDLPEAIVFRGKFPGIFRGDFGGNGTLFSGLRRIKGRHRRRQSRVFLEEEVKFPFSQRVLALASRM
jgi:hypothetical protein